MRRHSAWKLLYNPLEYLGVKAGLGIAFIVVIILTIVAWWGGVHLDGALDMHITQQPPSLKVLASESMISWLCMGIILYLVSIAFGSRDRAAAHLASAGLARFPYIIAAFITSRHMLGKVLLEVTQFSKGQVVINVQQFLQPVYMLGIYALVLLVVWSVAILYTGYKEAGRLQGWKTPISFITGVILAEIASKFIITPMIR